MARSNDEADRPDGEPSGAASAARLRERIDRGGAADKVGFEDPAAAPLGTDDEAAGTPPTAEQVRRAQAQESRSPQDDKGTPEDRQKRPGGGGLLLAAIAVACLVVLVGWVWVA